MAGLVGDVLVVEGQVADGNVDVVHVAVKYVCYRR